MDGVSPLSKHYYAIIEYKEALDEFYDAKKLLDEGHMLVELNPDTETLRREAARVRADTKALRSRLASLSAVAIARLICEDEG